MFVGKDKIYFEHSLSWLLRMVCGKLYERHSEEIFLKMYRKVINSDLWICFMKNHEMMWGMSCEMCSIWWKKFTKIMRFVLWNWLLILIVDLIVGIGGYEFGAQYCYEPIVGLVSMHINFRISFKVELQVL